MINETTQIVMVDEWCASRMESDLAKTLLQGGWMTTAVKHQQPRCFFNTCPFYITIGKEQENVLRRLAIFETESLKEVIVGVAKWIYDNAMACAAWIAKQINANLDMVEREERWYETKEPAAITNIASLASVSHIARVTHRQLNQRNSQESSMMTSPDYETHPSFVREAERRGKKHAPSRSSPQLPILQF